MEPKGVWATQNRTPTNPEQLQKTVNFLFISDMRFHTILKPFWVPSWDVLGPSLAVSVALQRDPESNRFLNVSCDLILADFHGFKVWKWSQVGMNIESKIDLILKAPKSRKILWNQYIIIDLSGLGDRSWKQKSNTNRSENGVSLRRPLGIDFSKNLIDFQLQVGTGNRAKTGQDAPES